MMANPSWVESIKQPATLSLSLSLSFSLSLNHCTQLASIELIQV